jgi:hypothetical protein
MNNSLLFEGLTDAVGFLVGSLLGFGLGYLFGLDIFAQGYSNSVIGGIVLVGLGGGLGLQGVRHWRQSRNTDDQDQ